MIPTDIKEMAKHDPLVAEILATGGPFFYADYQRLRNGEAEAVARSLNRKAGLAGGLFYVLVAIYSVLLVAGVVVADGVGNRVEFGIRVLSLLLYGGLAWTMLRKRKQLRELVKRVEAGEFSAD